MRALLPRALLPRAVVSSKPTPPDPANPPATVKSDSQSALAAKRRNKRDEAFVNRILYLIITVLLCLVARDIYQVQHLRQKVHNNELYVKAVRSSNEGWVTGWKLEELQSKLQTQNAVLRSLVMTLHSPFLSFFGSLRGAQPAGKTEADVVSDLYSHIENATALYTWTCVSRPASLIRIGQVDFFDSTPENCLVHSTDGSSHSGITSPSSMFEMVELGDGYVGFRSFANGKFVKVTPPASGKSSDLWWADLASPVAGLAERFRLEEGGRIIYNELLQGYLRCAGTGQAVPVLGAPGTSLEDVQYKPEYHFHMRHVTQKEVEQARVIKAMGKAITRTSSEELSSFQSATSIKVQYERLAAKEKLEVDEAQIAVLIPVTSKATTMYEVKDSPFFRNTLLSFLQTIDWQTNRFAFTFFLGFDQGDALYDTGDAWSDMRQAFSEHIRFYLSEAQVSPTIRQQVVKQLSLRLKHFRGKEGSPSQVVSELAKDAYSNGCDYFFQVNDDTVFKSEDWPTVFTSTLAESPLSANLGVTGPYDLNNPRILTHAFVHRTHLDIHGRFFPQAFSNWWSDDWISAVYGRYGTFRSHRVTVLHDIHAQKLGNTIQRYKVDEGAQLKLRGEVLSGMAKVNAFLVGKGRPRLPLPEVCGYVPLVEEVYDYLQHNEEEGRTAHGKADADELAWRSRLKQENVVQYEIQKNPPPPHAESDGGKNGPTRKQQKEAPPTHAVGHAGKEAWSGSHDGGGSGGGGDDLWVKEEEGKEEEEDDDFPAW